MAFWRISYAAKRWLRHRRSSFRRAGELLGLGEGAATETQQ
jgi:hypothetical protein